MCTGIEVREKGCGNTFILLSPIALYFPLDLCVIFDSNDLLLLVSLNIFPNS